MWPLLGDAIPPAGCARDSINPQGQAEEPVLPSLSTSSPSMARSIPKKEN